MLGPPLCKTPVPKEKRTILYIHGSTLQETKSNKSNKKSKKGNAITAETHKSG